MATNARIGHKTLFQLFDQTVSPAAWFTVGEVKNITPPSFARDAVDATHTESPEAWREFIPGLKDAGEITAELNLVPDSDSTEKLLGTFDSDDLQQARILFPDGTPDRADADVLALHHVMHHHRAAARGADRWRYGRHRHGQDQRQADLCEVDGVTEGHMANRLKGVVDIEAGGKLYAMVCSINALCELESTETDATAALAAVMSPGGAGRITRLRTVMRCLLSDHHPELTLKDVGAIMTDIGLVASFEAVSKAVMLAFPERAKEDDDAGPLSGAPAAPARLRLACIPDELGRAGARPVAVLAL